MHVRTTVYRRGRGALGVGRCACDKTNVINHVHAHLAGLGGVGWVLCRVVRTLLDLWGGVNGYGVSLRVRDQCGV